MCSTDGRPNRVNKATLSNLLGAILTQAKEKEEVIKKSWLTREQIANLKNGVALTDTLPIPM